MVSLSRYTIRMGIVFALLITSIGIIGTSTILGDVQDNVTTVQELRQDYLELDEEILSSLSSLENKVGDLLDQEIQYVLVNYLTGTQGNLGSTNITDVVSSLGDLRQLLNTRQFQDYGFDEVDSGIAGTALLGLEVPNVGAIIDDSTEGASNTYDDEVVASSSDFQAIPTTGQNIRSSFNEAEDNLLANISILENVYDTFDTNYDNFTETMYSNGTVEALSILEANHEMVNLIDILQQEYQNLLQEMHVSPLDSTSTTLAEEIQNSRTTLNEVETNVTSVGLSANDAVIYDALVSSAESALDAYEDVSNSSAVVIDEFETIYDFVDSTVSDIRIILDTIPTVYSIVEAENHIFEDQTSKFLAQLRNRLSTNTTYIVGAFAAIIILTFTWVFFAISMNIGRILGKNVKLAEGDLDIEIRDSYPKHEMGVIEESLDNFALQTRTVMKQLRDTSETLAGISEELAAGAEEASASISEVNSTVRDFSSGSAEQSLMLSRVRDELIDHLNIVEQTSNRIDETAKFVLRVAKRTNILGLNASIEAAKAGRFGLGFDVVAKQVRELSDETRRSASNIASNIEEIEINIRQTVQDILNEVNIIREVAQNTATGSEDASVATQEQVSMMNEVSQTSAQLSELSQSLNEALQNFRI